MVTSTLQITLPYPPEQVWQVVTDLTDTAWRSDIARVEVTGPGAFVEYTPAGVATRFTVTAQEPCRRWGVPAWKTAACGAAGWGSSPPRAAAHGCALQRRSSPSAGGWGPL